MTASIVAEIRKRLAAYHQNPSDDRVWQQAAQDFHHNAPTDLTRLCDRVEELEKALVEYGNHLARCPAQGDEDECQCGYTAALGGKP